MTADRAARGDPTLSVVRLRVLGGGLVSLAGLALVLWVFSLLIPAGSGMILSAAEGARRRVLAADDLVRYRFGDTTTEATAAAPPPVVAHQIAATAAVPEPERASPERSAPPAQPLEPRSTPSIDAPAASASASALVVGPITIRLSLPAL